MNSIPDNKKDSSSGFGKTTDYKWLGIGLLVFFIIWLLPTPESMLDKSKEIFGDLNSDLLVIKAYNMKVKQSIYIE